MATAGARIGFLGAGKMASALAKGWLTAGLTAADRLCASDPLPAARETFAKETGAFVTASNRDIMERCDVVVLAVKPQNMSGLLAEIQPNVTPKHLIVSIAAGITLGQLAAGLGADRRLIRVMPNTPCLVGASASAYAAGACATAADAQLVDRLLNSVGKAMAVPEKLLDAVTGLSGSGPAYVAVIIEALSDGGVRMGLFARHANGPGFRQIAAGNRPATRRSQGHGRQPRRHHHCRPARLGARWVEVNADGCRGGGDQARCRIRQGIELWPPTPMQGKR